MESVVRDLPWFLTLTIWIFFFALGEDWLMDYFIDFFSKETAFVHRFFFSSTDLKFSISLISIITFNPWFLTLDLICSFYHFLRWKLWLLNLIFVLLTCICKVKEAFFLKTWPCASSNPSVMAFAVWLSMLVHERSQCHLEVVKDKMNSSQGMEFFLLEGLSFWLP